MRCPSDRVIPRYSRRAVPSARVSARNVWSAGACSASIRARFSSYDGSPYAARRSTTPSRAASPSSWTGVRSASP